VSTTRIKPVTIQPHQVVADETIPPGPEVRANAAFTVVHYHDWDFDEVVGEWLPRLNEVRHAPGCNGVTENKGRANPAAALTGAVAKGGIIITGQDRRLGEYQNYLAAHKVRGGGLFFVYSWVEIALLMGGKAAKIVPNPERMRGFRRHLYESGIVPLMPREVLDTKIAVLESRLAKQRSMFNAGKITKDSFELKQSEIEALVVRYTEAYAKVADTPIPSDAEPAAEPRRAAPAPVPADPAVEQFAGKGKAERTTLAPAKPVAP
jgi:hypothetical protein